MTVQWAVNLGPGGSLANATQRGPVLTYWLLDGHGGTSPDAPLGHHGRPNSTRVAPTHTAEGPGPYAQFRHALAGLNPGASYGYTVDFTTL